uniref:Uncharacterized protein n=1 Tax=Anguilla anguilla TaxID=7936 RepID=A0A0E9VAT1_ANGAN
MVFVMDFNQSSKIGISPSTGSYSNRLDSCTLVYYEENGMCVYTIYKLTKIYVCTHKNGDLKQQK